MSSSEAQLKLAKHLKTRRLKLNLTQQGLASRSGVALSTLRKFEQSGQVSLQSFLKLCAVLGGLDELVQALSPAEAQFKSIDDVLAPEPPQRQRGVIK